MVEVHYFAGASAAAGVAQETVDVPAEATLAELCAAVAANRPALAPVLAVASLLVDEVPTADRNQPLGAARRVDVLPPFAGG